MALTYLSTTISNPQNGRSTDHRMLVDSGATYSVIPANVLKKLHNAWVIGATTLENMGFVLDPINRRLLSLPMTI